MGEALDFKFGQYIHRVHLNKSPLNFGEKGAWAYPGTVQILGAPLLSQERVKDCANFGGTPTISGTG